VTHPLRHAGRIQRAAARQGFDWAKLSDLWPKLEEEVAELRLAAGNRKRAEEELGDLLFMAVNLARHLGVSPERALRSANAKFLRRYAFVIKHVKTLPPLRSRQRLDAMEALWQEAKRNEKAVSRKGRQGKQRRKPG